MDKKRIPLKRDTFDFEIGHLSESPCRRCIYRRNLPDCADNCSLMEKIRLLLAKGISCTGPYFIQ
ncbi:MAG TPA: hypothetical protein VKO20_10085 [Desulfosalsimonadaceae bacterium]|nr:hypothetical protein [Desulfosalsimonadaceae bacterium]